ncbi:hypothetical protein TruAng_008902 [Truncatella angustata]|nr:hypothetical protein TruAng_008902 [Truncatella angustata]
MRATLQSRLLSLLVVVVILLSPVTSAMPSYSGNAYDVVNTANNSFCVNQDDPNLCTGSYKCDTSNMDSLECVFWVYNATCKTLHAQDPWGVSAGDNLSFEGLDQEVKIQNVTETTDKDKINVVFRYGNKSYGDGKSNYVRDHCPGLITYECAYMASTFTCK